LVVASRNVVVKILLGIANPLLVSLMMVALLYPPFLAEDFWDPLDNTLYWAGFGIGCALAAVLMVPIRWGRDGNWRLLGFFAPTWMSFFAVGANVWFDRSPAVLHGSRYVGHTYTSKGRGSFRLASWRKPGAEERIVGNSPAVSVALGSALAGNAAVGTPVVVTTHAGALGWEWVALVRKGSLVVPPNGG